MTGSLGALRFVIHWLIVINTPIITSVLLL